MEDERVTLPEAEDAEPEWEIVRATEKALLLKHDGRERWVPKSIWEKRADGNTWAENWVAEKFAMSEEEASARTDVANRALKHAQANPLYRQPGEVAEDAVCEEEPHWPTGLDSDEDVPF